MKIQHVTVKQVIVTGNVDASLVPAVTEIIRFVNLMLVKVHFYGLKILFHYNYWIFVKSLTLFLLY